MALVRLVGLVSWRLVTRLWLAASCLGLLCLLIVGRCGLPAADPSHSLAGKGSEVSSGYVSLLEQREEENRAEVARLTAEIRALKLQLLQYNGPPVPLDSGNSTSWWCRGRLRRPDEESTERGGSGQGGGEQEAIPFAHFTLTRVHPPAQGSGRRVVERPTGYHRKALLEAVNEALDQLNRNNTLHGRTKQTYTTDHFLEGIFRTVPTSGTEYEMHFRSPQGGGARVSVLRPFASPLPLGSTPLPPKRLLHAVLPLAGRLQTFRGFIEKFVKIALKNDRHVALTVVYFGEEGLSEARQVMSRVAAKGHSSALRLLALNETFDRVKGLKVGAQRPWNSRGAGEDVLLFLADVDLVFSGRFLERCRWYARPGGSVYFPVVFSLYSPRLVYTLQGRPMPSETGQLVVSRDTGYWRDAGYGISCQYKSDFLRVVSGEDAGGPWGEEEVLLYRKFLQSPLKVVRATDPGIFHLWHPKVCSGPRQTEHYRACVRARALTEGSHGQLGALAFRGREAEMAGAAPEVPSGGSKKNKKQQEKKKATKAKEET